MIIPTNWKEEQIFVIFSVVSVTSFGLGIFGCHFKIIIYFVETKGEVSRAQSVLFDERGRFQCSC